MKIDFNVFDQSDIDSMPEDIKIVVSNCLREWRGGVPLPQIGSMAQELNLLAKSRLLPEHYPILAALVMCRDEREVLANIERYKIMIADRYGSN